MVLMSISAALVYRVFNSLWSLRRPLRNSQDSSSPKPGFSFANLNGTVVNYTHQGHQKYFFQLCILSLIFRFWFYTWKPHCVSQDLCVAWSRTRWLSMNLVRKKSNSKSKSEKIISEVPDGYSSPQYRSKSQRKSRVWVMNCHARFVNNPSGVFVDLHSHRFTDWTMNRRIII